MVLYSHSWREALFYAIKLDKMFSMSTYDIVKNAKDLADADEALNYEIRRLPADKIQSMLSIKPNLFDGIAPSLIEQLRQNFDDAQLPDDAFEWIEKDLRICAFCYHFLVKKSGEIDEYNINDKDKKPLRIRDTRSPLVLTNRYVTIEQFLNANDCFRVPYIRSINVTTDNHIQRLSGIKTAFRHSEVDSIGQHEILRLLSEAWKMVFNDQRSMDFKKWFDAKDTTQIEWLNSYMKKKFTHFHLPWEPASDEEIYFALQADFDYQFLINPTLTEALFSKARLAWNQRKFQNKNCGTKSRAISMSERTNKRLDWLAKHQDKKINATIKALIDSEFEHLGGPSKL